MKDESDDALASTISLQRATQTVSRSSRKQKRAPLRMGWKALFWLLCNGEWGCHLSETETRRHLGVEPSFHGSTCTSTRLALGASNPPRLRSKGRENDLRQTRQHFVSVGILSSPLHVCVALCCIFCTNRDHGRACFDSLSCTSCVWCC